MGKQSKRKNKSTKKSIYANNNNNTSTNKTTINNNNNNIHNDKNNHNQIIIKKLRHGDKQTRFATLAALSSTLFSPNSLISTSNNTNHANTNKQIDNIDLIQTISERILDQDIPSATCATGCMMNYILFYNYHNNNNNIDYHQMETILSPILLTRIHTTLDALETLTPAIINSCNTNHDNISQQTKSLNKVQQQQLQSFIHQWNLILLSISTICGIIENTSTHTTSSSLLHHELKKFLSTITRLITIAYQYLSASPDDDEDNNHHHHHPSTILMKMISTHYADDEEYTTTIPKVFIYCMRTIHASCDDNWNFTSFLFSSNIVISSSSTLTSTTVSLWEYIHQIVSHHRMPVLARLHASGIVSNTRALLISNISTHSNNTSDNDHQHQQQHEMIEQIDRTIQSHILPLLFQSSSSSQEQQQKLWNDISSLHHELKKEKEEKSMESDIIRNVNEKKESAKLIARRQKKMRDAGFVPNHHSNVSSLMNGDENGSENEVDANIMMVNNDLTIDDSKENDTRDKYEKTLNVWKTSCLPLKLSIEIITNMCSGQRAEMFDNNDQDDDGMDWDSDREEEFMINGGETRDKPSSSKLVDFEVRLPTIIQSSGIPDQVLIVFGRALLSLLNRNNSSNIILPDEVVDDLCEIITKCAICIGNMFSNLHEWKQNTNELKAVWSDLCNSLHSATITIQTPRTSDAENATSTNSDSIPFREIGAICSTMTALLRFREETIQMVKEENLQVLFSCLLINRQEHIQNNMIVDNKEEMDIISDFQKDVVTILSILCSKPHSEDANRKICSILLQVLSQQSKETMNAALISEILNALMDMYSLDEGDAGNHENIFRSMNVLAVFESSLSILKENIRNMNHQDFEFHVWKETVLNASRFIRYKKGY